MKYFWALVFVGMFCSGYAVGLQEIKLEIYDAVQDEVDETTINLDYGTTNAYNYTEDSKKILSGVLQSPQLFSITTDNINCLINSNGPFNAGETIPLGFRSYNTGNYSIRIKSTSNLDATCIVRLEDKATGIIHELQTGNYTFTLSGQQLTTNRFYLHVSRPTEISTITADCNSQNGTILIDQDTTIKWNQCQLFDDQNQLVSSLTNVTGQYSFSGLPAGDYAIAFIYGNHIGTKLVTVGSQQVSVTIGVSTQTIATGQQVQFSSWATNAMYYEWDFGDGTIITNVANPQLAFYVPGTYNVVLTASNNAGCQGFAYITIVVTQATDINGPDANEAGKVYNIGSDIIVENTNATTYSIVNLMGQTIATGNLNTGMQSIPMQHQASGIYIVQLHAPQGVFSTKLRLN